MVGLFLGWEELEQVYRHVENRGESKIECWREYGIYLKGLGLKGAGADGVTRKRAQERSIWVHM